MRVQIIIPKELLKELDIYCISNGYTRSEFIRNSIRRLLPSIKDSSIVLEMVDKLKNKPTPVPEIKKGELIKPKEFGGEPTIDNFIAQKQIKLCQHGAAMGLCKFGCR